MLLCSPVMLDHPLDRRDCKRPSGKNARAATGDRHRDAAASAADGEQAIDAVARHRPDVVLMDLRMPGVGGLEETAQITVHHPNTAVVVLTMDSDHDSVFAALRAGARGYLLKEATAMTYNAPCTLCRKEKRCSAPESPNEWSASSQHRG